MKKLIALFAAFVATVYGANWAAGEYGIIDVGFGLTAPAGVLFAGAAFTLRDELREAAGKAWRRWVFAAIGAGAALSYFLADAITLPNGIVLASASKVAIGSALAFALSETADAAVYEPLRRSWPKAVVASNVVGAVVDSVVFLWLVFGSLDFVQGQVVAKLYMTAIALPFVAWRRRHRHQWGPTSFTWLGSEHRCTTCNKVAAA